MTTKYVVRSDRGWFCDEAGDVVKLDTYSAAVLVGEHCGFDYEVEVVGDPPTADEFIHMSEDEQNKVIEIMTRQEQQNLYIEIEKYNPLMARIRKVFSHE